MNRDYRGRNRNRLSSRFRRKFKMAATIIRLKRKIDEVPSEGISISCKKLCEENSNNISTDSETTKQFFEYAGTQQGKEKLNSLYGCIQDNLQSKKGPQNGSKDSPRHTSDSPKTFAKTVKLRRALESADNLDSETLNKRFKSSNAEDVSEEVPSIFSVYDVIEEDNLAIDDTKSKKVSEDTDVVTCNGIPLTKHPNEGKFVYDLYIANNANIEENIEDYRISVEKCPLAEDFVAEDYREYEEISDDEEDSNAEDNWRNEYPDSDDDRSSCYDDGMCERDYFDIDDLAAACKSFYVD